MTSPAVSTRLTPDPIRPEEVLGRVGGDEDGAVLLFLGTVRDHADGRPVRGLRYEAYEAMAAEVLDEIARDAARSSGVRRLHVVHRTGELDVGEVSVAIASSSPHRDESYRASRQVIEEIKKRLPVWKREFYIDGEAGWVEGTDPRTGGSTGSGPAAPSVAEGGEVR